MLSGFKGNNQTKSTNMGTHSNLFIHVTVKTQASNSSLNVLK